MKKLLILLILFSFHESKSQLVTHKNFYPSNSIVRIKHFNGCTKNWNSIITTDQLGNPVKKEDICDGTKKTTITFTYNTHGDVTSSTAKSNYYNVDEQNINYSYKYDSLGNITYQMAKYANGNYKITELIKIINDSTFKYNHTNFYFNKDSLKANQHKEVYLIKYSKAGKIIEFERFDSRRNDYFTEIFEYYPDCWLKAIAYKYVPGKKDEPVKMVGADNISYENIYNKKGLVKKIFSTIKGKKQKSAEYRYLKVK